MAGVTDRMLMDALAVSFLIERLNWPVPMVRWRAARAIRDLVNAPETRADTTNALLAFLSAATTETEACAVLTILLMARREATPPPPTLIAAIRRPSILAGVLVRHMHGEDGVDWRSAHSGHPPGTFEPEPYFSKYCTAHVPAILSSNLKRLEGHSGFPFMRQWAFEWHCLQQQTGVRRTEYPYYFSDYLEVQSGIIGQYIQRQGEIFRSAYLRTLAFAVNVWRLPAAVAEKWCMDLVPAIAGLFDVDPGPRPSWLGDFPERCAKAPDNLEGIVRELLDATHTAQMRPVAIHAPIRAEVAPFGDLSLTAHLVTHDFVPSANEPSEWLEFAALEESFELTGERTSTPLFDYSSEGVAGLTAPVCTSLFPQPYGYWQQDYYSTGIPMPASYVIPSGTTWRCTANGIELEDCGRGIATTSFWLDQWTPRRPREGSTRCGSQALLDAALLDEACARLKRSLRWRARIRLWQRERDFDDYKLTERAVQMGTNGWF